MQVTDEMIETACAHHWPGPWPGDRSEKVLAIRREDMRLALTAALSDQERAVEVKIKPLEFNDDPCPAAACAFGHYVINPIYWHVELLIGYGRMSMTGLGRVQLNNGASIEDLRSAAQADYEQRIRSALVGVPVEPDTVFASRHNDETGECETVEIEPVKVRQLREKIATNPPHREGEDSAEVERLRDLLSRAEEYVIDGVTNAKAEAEMNAPYPARAPRYDAALAEVRQLYADIQAALAATRSASASTAKGASDAQ